MNKTNRLDGGAKIAFLLEGSRIDKTIADFCNELVIPTGREAIREIVREVVEGVVREEIKHAKRRSETSNYFRALDDEPNPAKIVVSDTRMRSTPAQQTLNLGRAKTQPRLVATFRGKPHQQFLSGIYSAWEKLSASSAFDEDGYISAHFVTKSHVVAESDATTKERIDAMKKAGIVRETIHHGRPYYRVHRDAARVVDAIKSAKFRTSGQRSVYFERPIPAADV